MVNVKKKEINNMNEFHLQFGKLRAHDEKIFGFMRKPLGTTKINMLSCPSHLPLASIICIYIFKDLSILIFNKKKTSCKMPTKRNSC
ncbi:hypothetical protein CISIN_1g034720mg [Citrus sinensis]|uniref:Uncharacterized protein n=1 Tax=Citrus sinensis TaxID=2711 RepID=A0A067DF59_CITSI|nr:hypothetical protein CISIN_1g034720mg [Citrus sinensis]